MLKLLTMFCLFFSLFAIIPLASAESKSAEREVVVLVAPSVNDNYYRSVFDKVIAYDIDFVNTVRWDIPVVLIVDQATLPYVDGKIPPSNLIVATIGDIWVRDFSPVFPNSPVKFSYRPNYLSATDAAYIENSFINWTKKVTINLTYSNIVLDGGNFVHNGVDKAVITRRIFSDNPNLTEAQFEQELFELTGITTVAYTPEEEGDATGHSDGQVMWLDSNTLVVNQYDEPFRTQMLTPLQTAFPDVTIIEIPVDYTEEYFGEFASACGLHINSLTTDDLIIMPTYRQTNDAVVKEIIQAHTSKKVVTVDASQVCIMGGSVRCLTWYAKGIEADKVLAKVQKPTPTAIRRSSMKNSSSTTWVKPFFFLTLLLLLFTVSDRIRCFNLFSNSRLVYVAKVFGLV